MKQSIRFLNKYIDTQLFFTSLISLALLMLSFRALAEQIPVVKIDGSSTVFPITEAVAEEFQKDQKGKVRVTVGISGTGGGFKKFCRGETDVQNASRPISASEMADCKTAGIKYFELPIAFDALVVAVHPQNNWVTEITVDQLKTIWQPEAQGKILKWNQVNSKWPDAPLKLFGAGSDSGTFDYFTEAVTGKAKSSRGDYTASEDDNTLVQGISTDKNALGYLPLAYYEQNKSKLKALAVIRPADKVAVMPTAEAVNLGKYAPFSRPVFIYVNEASYKRTEVLNFSKFYLAQATNLVPTVKYIPLPQKAYDLGLGLLNKGKVGTKFSGHAEIGLKIEDVLKKESKL
jgi:phosphate transport system substrate-binding protein